MNLQSPFRIGIKPKDGNQYINELQIGNVKLVVNTSIEEADDVQRIGVVFSLPKIYDGDLQIGDEVVVHHNFNPSRTIISPFVPFGSKIIASSSLSYHSL